MEATIKFDAAVRATVRANLALGFAIAVSTAANASDTPIYKCVRPDGGVLYTDSLCKGRKQLDIQPSAPDPAAIERLERAQAAFDRSAAKRVAEAEINAARTAERERLLAEAEAARRDADAAFTYASGNDVVGWAPYPVFVHPRVHRPRPPRLPMRPRPTPNPRLLVPQH